MKDKKIVTANLSANLILTTIQKLLPTKLSADKSQS